MKIQQHNGVVVVEQQHSGRASPSSMEKEEVLEREREAPKAWIERPSFPHYI